MAVNKKEEPLKWGRIPVNYSGYFNIGGFSVSKKGTYEGIAGGLFFIGLAFILKNFIAWYISIYIGAIGVLVAIVLGMLGIDGDRISVRAINAIKYKITLWRNKTSLAAFYNPRIKEEEAKKVEKTNELQNESAKYARNNAERWLLEWKEKHISSQAVTNMGEINIDLEEELPDTLFFEEDVDIVEAPKEYIVSQKKENKEKEDTEKVGKEKKHGKKKKSGKKKKTSKKRRTE